MKNKMLAFLSIIFCLSAHAQNTVNNSTSMAETMRSNGKIYVVVAVVLTILIGLFFYLFRIDKKISALEKDQTQQ